MVAYSEHEHVADAAEVNARKSYNKMKKSAKTSNESPSVIVGKVISKASSSTAAVLPSMIGLKKNIQRQRSVANPQLLTPATLAELDIDNGTRNRFLIFGTQENLQRLGSCRIWMSDGTFSSVPRVFQ